MTKSPSNASNSCNPLVQLGRLTDRPTDRPTDRSTDRLTARPTDRPTDRTLPRPGPPNQGRKTNSGPGRERDREKEKMVPGCNLPPQFS